MVVFDTNILVSAALLSGSRADFCVRAFLASRHPLIFSPATFHELAEVLMRSKFDAYVSRRTRETLLRSWRKAAVMFPETAIREKVHDCRDPQDDKFLELALNSGAHALVTGDPDLLVLDPWRGIRIVKLREFEGVVLPLIEAE